MKKVLVAGGTGLVGSFLLQALSADGDFDTTALVRRHGALPQSLLRTHELVFDFDNPADYQRLSSESFDFVFCCLGTTIKKAGSAAQFRKVDFEYPWLLLKTFKSTAPIFALVSSVGADAPTGLYLKTKAELEREVLSSGLISVIIRPSLLLGERKEFRLLESLSVKTLGRFEYFLRHRLGEHIAKYAPVHARDVAKALINGAIKSAEEQKSIIIEGRGIQPDGRIA